jgi:hypothetical protein
VPQPIRLVIPIDSDDPDAWSFAIGYAQAIGKQAQPAAKDHVLLTHGKQQLKHTSLAGHMGDAAAKALIANRTVELPQGAQLRHATLQTLGGYARGAVIVAYYADDKMLETLDGIDGLIGIIAVPDIANNIEKWVARWSPAVHGQEQSAPAVLIADPVVEKALSGLSTRINLSHAIMNPRDKGHADETLRILRAKGHTFEPDKMKSWAIKNGWKPGAGDELAKLAARIGALKSKPSLSRYHDPQGRYDRWSQ